MSAEPPQIGRDAVMTDVLVHGRTACYKARDAFYACLEKEADKKPTEIATVGLLYPSQCKAARAEFAAKCRPTWVKHFDRQYCAKKSPVQFNCAGGLGHPPRLRKSQLEGCAEHICALHNGICADTDPKVFER